MVEINAEWDEEDYQKTLETAFSEYREACYGKYPLSPVQEREVRQAFLSGVHWLSQRDDYDPSEITTALRVLLRL